MIEPPGELMYSYVFLGIFGLEEEHLRSGQVCHVVINRRANKNNVLFQQPRIDIVGALAAAGLFDHHRYEGCSAILRIIEFFHGVNVAGTGPECFTLHPWPHLRRQRS